MSPPPRRASWADDGEATEEEPFWRAARGRGAPVRGGIQINATRGPSRARGGRPASSRCSRPPASAGGWPAAGLRPAGPDRLPRGRRGRGPARVQGSAARPYRVRIGSRPWTRRSGTAVLDALAATRPRRRRCWRASCPARSRTSSPAQGVALFPAERGDLAMDCTCPDATVPCKHLAAVFYLLAERFDADPFAVLALRGRDRETVLDELRARRTRTPDAPPLPVEPAAFYAAPPHRTSRPDRPRRRTRCSTGCRRSRWPCAAATSSSCSARSTGPSTRIARAPVAERKRRSRGLTLRTPLSLGGGPRAHQGGAPDPGWEDPDHWGGRQSTRSAPGRT